MSLDVEILSESYQALKQYIPQKDRQEASDALMSILVDALTDEEAKEFASTDAYTKRSYDEYAGEEDEEEYEDYEE
jgi:DNA-directed RNA polymerase delta subunit